MLPQYLPLRFVKTGEPDLSASIALRAESSSKFEKSPSLIEKTSEKLLDFHVLAFSYCLLLLLTATAVFTRI